MSKAKKIRTYEEVSNKGNKLPVRLVDPCIVKAIASQQKFGMDKGYVKDSWKVKNNIEESLEALERHLLEIKEGNWVDPESKLPHMYAIACRAMYIIWFKLHEKEKEDMLL